MGVKRSLWAVLVTAVMVGATVGVPVSPASAGPSIGVLSGAGERPGATRLAFTAGDSVQAQVDVGSGNLLVSVRGIVLPDVNRQVVVGAFYNSAAASATPVPRLGRGWGLDYTPDVRLVVNADSSVTYHASGGLVGVFDLAAGSTTAYKHCDWEATAFRRRSRGTRTVGVRARPWSIKPNARTLGEHRGLPQLLDRPSRQAQLGDPRRL